MSPGSSVLNEPEFVAAGWRRSLMLKDTLIYGANKGAASDDPLIIAPVLAQHAAPPPANLAP